MKKMKKLFVGMSIFLFVMCVGIGFSYGDNLTLPSYGKNLSSETVRNDVTYDYVLSGTGVFMGTYVDSEGSSSGSILITKATISLAVVDAETHMFLVEFVFELSNGSVYTYYVNALFRNSSFYFNTTTDSDPTISTTVYDGFMKYTEQLEFVINLTHIDNKGKYTVTQVYTGVCSF
jgi:hypothetical protein